MSTLKRKCDTNGGPVPKRINTILDAMESMLKEAQTKIHAQKNKTDGEDLMDFVTDYILESENQLELVQYLSNVGILIDYSFLFEMTEHKDVLIYISDHQKLTQLDKDWMTEHFSTELEDQDFLLTDRKQILANTIIKQTPVIDLTIET